MLASGEASSTKMNSIPSHIVCEKSERAQSPIHRSTP